MKILRFSETSENKNVKSNNLIEFDLNYNI